MSASESHSEVVLQLAEEFLERYRQGQRPSLKEYIDRHPELAVEIKEVFPAMALMENVALADESVDGAATGPATPVDSAPPQQLGDYRILREVGRGGMGIVYEAEQVSLGRHVALKVLPRQIFVDDQQRRRFEREAKAAAKLHHTNIVPVFGVGEHEGLPYYVMQFIQGLGLDDVLDELKRMQSSGTPTGTGGELRVSRKDVSAADVARSLMTGAFQEAREDVLSRERVASASDSSRSSATGKLSNSFTLSSSVKLPGSESVLHGKNNRATYWHSVAQIGVQVAQALEYAHKQGIQHRDIKPSNLLLDTRGTVWVTDFGLARADNEDHLTQTGDIVGTLRYMPPEAFEGRADKRGDIYSLGLTLYELLALKPAYEERDRHRLIKRVTTEEPAQLDKRNSSIPRDLVTTIHKAIEREPSRRYQTATDLAADLQRFLDDEPIQARPISSAERLVRWCRHHPGVAMLTAALVVMLLGVTVASLLAAARFDRLAEEQAETAEKERLARRAAEESKEQEEGLRKQAEEAKKQAESNLHEAERQRQRAESNFVQARKAVDDYFTMISESQLLKVPGMQPLRRDLLQSALTFYQDFLKERGEDPAIRAELAAAYLRVGRIRSELGQWSEARKAYEEARLLYEALTKATPESVEWRHGLAQCYHWQGRYDEAIKLWQKLVQPGQPRFHKELAEAYNSRAIQYSNATKLGEALQAHQQALVIREMLVRLSPEDPDSLRDLGSTLNNIGVLLSQNGPSSDALAMFRRAADYSEAAFARAPQVIENGRFLSISLNNIASMEHQLGRENEALTAYRLAVEVWQKLARDNPAVPRVQSGLFNAYRQLWYHQRDRGQTEEAERTKRLVNEVGERLPSDSPDDLYNLACFRALCSSSLGSGKDKPTVEDRTEQKREADLAIEALRKAITAGFRDLDLFRRDADLNALRGREDFKALEADLSTRVARATATDKLKASQQALALHQKAAQADPKNKRLRADLAASQHAIALVLLNLGKLEEAQQHLQQAIGLRETLVKEEPNNAQYHSDLALSRFALGDFSWRSGRLAEGAKLLQQELSNLKAMARQGANHSALAGQLATMQRMMAQHYARAGLWAEAASHYDRLLQLERTDAFDHYCAAFVALRAGDTAAYRRICAAMGEHYEQSENYFDLGWLAWACVLADGAGTDPGTAIKRAMKMTGGNSRNEWQCHIIGLAHYRAGQFAEAIAQASKSNSLNPAWYSRILNYPVLAMAHHRLGHAAESQRWLEKAITEWRRISPLFRSPGSLTVIPSTWEYWQDWPTFEMLLREASLLITGAPPVGEAYDRTHRSLLYIQLGESKKAEAQWQEAVKIAPRDPALYLARGRIFAQLGHQEKADADFAKAAALTPEELDRFLQAGWWVMGPYPEDRQLPGSPEKNPDPSRPIAAADGAAKLNWKPVQAQGHGQVDLRAVFNANHISAYALTYVYSPQERTVTLLLGGDDRVRVWLNGRLVHETNRRNDDDWALHRVPVALKAGRNTLLCKVSQETGPHSLTLRIADHPFDRAAFCADLGLWDEAAALFARGIDRQPSTEPAFFVRCAHAHLLLGDTAGYRRYLARMFEQHDDPNSKINQPFDWLAYAGCLLDGAVKPTRLVELAERALANGRAGWVLHVAGIAYYRAGQYEQAIDRLEESLKDSVWQGGGGHASELGLALAHHRLGQVQQARQWLEKAEQWYEKAIQDALAAPFGRASLCWWMDWPSFVVLRREAHKVMAETDLKEDPRLKKLAERLREWLTKRDPATADFDVALLLFPDDPRLLLARGRRLAELKRKEAEADLTRAVQLKPGDPQVWQERGRIYFELGQSDKAAADFRKAAELSDDNTLEVLALPSGSTASEADKLFAQLADDAFLSRLTAGVQRSPEDMAQRWRRGNWQAKHARWKEAAADLRTALEQRPSDDAEDWLSAAKVLAVSDRDGYRWLCREMLKRFGETQDPPTAERTAKACLLLPQLTKEREQACQLADRAVVLGRNHQWELYFIFCKGLADYRKGNFRAVIERLEALLPKVGTGTPSWTTEIHLILAMALDQQGDKEAARQHLTRAVKLLDEYLIDPVRVPILRNARHNHDWLIAWLLYHEALSLIEGHKAGLQK